VKRWDAVSFAEDLGAHFGTIVSATASVNVTHTVDQINGCPMLRIGTVVFGAIHALRMRILAS